MKLLFIGVYQADILVRKFPLKIKLNFWIQGETTQTDNELEFDLSLKPLKGGKKKSIARANLSISIPDTEFKDGWARMNCMLGGLDINVEEDSILAISGRSKGGRFRLIDSREVILNPERSSEQ